MKIQTACILRKELRRLIGVNARCALASRSTTNVYPTRGGVGHAMLRQSGVGAS